MWILLNSHPLPHTKTHNFQQYLFKAPIFSGSEHCPHIPQLLSSNLIPQNPLTLPFMCLFLVYFLIFLQTLHYRSLRISVASQGLPWGGLGRGGHCEEVNRLSRSSQATVFLTKWGHPEMSDFYL